MDDLMRRLAALVLGWVMAGPRWWAARFRARGGAVAGPVHTGRAGGPVADVVAGR